MDCGRLWGELPEASDLLVAYGIDHIVAAWMDWFRGHWRLSRHCASVALSTGLLTSTEIMFHHRTAATLWALAREGRFAIGWSKDTTSNLMYSYDRLSSLLLVIIVVLTLGKLCMSGLARCMRAFQLNIEEEWAFRVSLAIPVPIK